MRYRNILTGMCIIASAIAGPYYYTQYDTRVQIDQANNIIDQYVDKLNEYENTIKSLKSKMPKKDALFLGKAIQNHGYQNVKALALNGLNECPSATTVNKRLRCHEIEEAAVMYAAINLLRLGQNGKTLKQVIYSKTGKNQKTYMFSWVPDPSYDDDSKHFQNSLIMAGHILGGSPKYEAANFQQFYYCNHDYTRVVNGQRIRKSGCGWHKSDSNLIELGRLNLDPEADLNVFILDKNLTRHNFFTLTPEYLRRSKYAIH